MILKCGCEIIISVSAFTAIRFIFKWLIRAKENYNVWVRILLNAEEVIFDSAEFLLNLTVLHFIFPEMRFREIIAFSPWCAARTLHATGASAGDGDSIPRLQNDVEFHFRTRTAAPDNYFSTASFTRPSITLFLYSTLPRPAGEQLSVR
jgi:hypothetical protein